MNFENLQRCLEKYKRRFCFLKRREFTRFAFDFAKEVVKLNRAFYKSEG
jgi:hypothetical protein